ncbi:MAG: acetyl-CoA hydrolase/transferase C-terminal domain-containing protein [Pseudomonadales bacterium]|jgi:4-hydroxybutyrate CoA-transferase|nr:acetyl-CoA hydrolase/transferase C-terminal domain-containing protein [Pseudomonadales bacterium]MDP7359138.1 acetyl-CoA hydrolase/transferase C-terminal domain-containing protein [Pseudomonadales bacterium]MDP7594611.1 acetyl-CoA hydrolase/transferase C-terminal domain-containing protein [Pseudomonadales bacterium]HJN52311.1 acetyl-CoA hydrolase/transferase C-terminal domain-containing protein [Pseudomonadales bacterium]|tara:strand:- start:9711 stop:11024 length:1314 start_codon:yes stop_codon:yes gene_type:complete
MDWQEEYQRKLVTAEEAVSNVRSGNRIAFSVNEQPIALSEALTARLVDLRDVEIHISNPIIDFGWFEPGMREFFEIKQLSYAGRVARPMSDRREIDYMPLLYSIWPKAEVEGRPGIRGTDVFMMLASPPDQDGYLSFGWSIWGKKSYLDSAKKVIVEVNANLPRLYGDNQFHVSEIDHIVEHDYPRSEFKHPEPEDYMRAIGQHVGTLVRDGDTIAIGAGRIGNTLCAQGIFDDRNDLGYHAENIVPGIVPLVNKGVMTGNHKTLNRGKVVCNNFLADPAMDFAFIDRNPMFELHPQEYVVNIRTISAHDNMVAINGALSVDLTGQIASESIGPRMYTGSGGQPSFAIGSMLSKGGRSIIMLRSTSNDGNVSRITSCLDAGTIVTVPRNFADYIVTEFGIASLLGKSQRERAQELIAIAHPDFRSELERQARKLFWP